MGTMNGIDERFDGETYLRTMVERGPGQVRHRTARKARQATFTYSTISSARDRRRSPRSSARYVPTATGRWLGYSGTMRSVRNQGRHPYRRAVAIWYWIDHGGRTDLAQAAEAIRSGMDIREVALEFPEPFIKYHKGMMAYKKSDHLPWTTQSAPDGPEVWVFWGATGTGKSRRAFETWPDAYRKMTNDKWWWEAITGKRQSSSTTSRALLCVYTTSSSL